MFQKVIKDLQDFAAPLEAEKQYVSDQQLFGDRRQRRAEARDTEPGT